MIELYSGTPGSGKSLHTADLMKRWLNMWKAPVICNFSFNAKACNPKGWGSLLIVDNKQLNPDFLIYFSETYKKMRGWNAVPEEHNRRINIINKNSRKPYFKNRYTFCNWEKPIQVLQIWNI